MEETISPEDTVGSYGTYGYSVDEYELFNLHFAFEKANPPVYYS